MLLVGVCKATNPGASVYFLKKRIHFTPKNRDKEDSRFKLLRNAKMVSIVHINAYQGIFDV